MISLPFQEGETRKDQMKRNIRMKKLIFSLLALLSVSASSYAQDGFFNEEGLYVGVFGGANLNQNDWNRINKHLKTGYVVGGSIGYKLCNNLRLEIEGAYRNNEFKHERRTNHFETATAFVNALVDIDFCSCLTPYVGVGLGYANLFKSKNHHRRDELDTRDRNKFQHNRNQFARQAIIGVSYRLFCSTDVAFEYRFFTTKFRGRSDSFILAARQYF